MQSDGGAEDPAAASVLVRCVHCGFAFVLTGSSSHSKCPKCARAILKKIWRARVVEMS